jgi:hypothetical protein
MWASYVIVALLLLAVPITFGKASMLEQPHAGTYKEKQA